MASRKSQEILAIDLVGMIFDFTQMILTGIIQA